jgi:hypothetical protein
MARAGLITDYRKVRSFRQIHWFYALNAGRILLDFLAQGGELHSTNFNNCVNTWGQNIIEASKEGAWLSPVGYVYRFLANLDARYPLQTDVTTGPGVFVSAQACESASGGIDLLVVNRGTRAVPVDLAMPAGFRLDTAECAYAPDRLSGASLGRSDISVEEAHAAGSAIALRPLSLTRIRARRA